MGSAAIQIDNQRSADQYVSRLAKAVKQMGYEATIVEPSTRLTVNVPHGGDYMRETVTLRPDDDNNLMWWWSWGKPIDHATRVSNVAALIIDVVAVTRA